MVAQPKQAKAPGSGLGQSASQATGIQGPDMVPQSESNMQPVAGVQMSSMASAPLNQEVAPQTNPDAAQHF